MSYKLCHIGSTPYIVNGNPLVGGKVFTYVANSSTPKTTASDNSGTANTNPVVFDQYGLAAIWLNTDANYKIIVKSADESITYETIDNVEGMSSALTGSPALTAVLDSNGNEVEGFSGVASALNYINLTNAATGNKPIIKSVGDDVNVGLKVDCQGSGTVQVVPATTFDSSLTVSGAFVSSGTLSPAQITSNQNDYAPTGFSTAFLLNLTTDADRTVTGLAGGATGRMIFLLNGGSFNITLAANSGSSSSANRFFMNQDLVLPSKAGVLLVYGGAAWTVANSNIVASTANEMETATATSSFVSPGRQRYHPSSTKAWCKFTSITTTAIVASYRVTSVTDGGTGTTTITLTDTFDSADYNVTGMGRTTNDGTVTVFMYMSNTTAPSTTAYKVLTYNSAAGGLLDCISFTAVQGDSS